MTRRAVLAVLACAAMIALSACGKKGAPLAPLNLVPEPPSALAAKRVGASVYIEMAAPKKNANGPGLLAIDHLEIYGVTVGTGFATPPNRELLTSTYLVGRIDIKPPVDEDEPVEDAGEPDTRPGPGDKVTFREELTEKQLQSAPGLKPLPPAQPALPAGSGGWPPSSPLPGPVPVLKWPGSTADAMPAPVSLPSPAADTPAAPAAAPAAAAATPPGPVRVYIIRGVTRKGRPGPPTTRVTIPLVPPPPAPGALAAKFTETAVSVTWVAPVADVGTAPAMAFNVYSPRPSTATTGAKTASPPAASVPLNDTPITGTAFERAGAPPGVEQCFEVRTVEKVQDVTLESDPTGPVCLTPRDTFPPAAPKGLAVVAMEGAIMNLIWDANTEPDLAGYVILRGEAPGDRLQPLTPEPIHDTKFTDTTVKAGVRYVYAVVAVDRATPPNRSAPSAPVEDTAR